MTGSDDPGAVSAEGGKAGVARGDGAAVTEGGEARAARGGKATSPEDGGTAGAACELLCGKDGWARLAGGDIATGPPGGAEAVGAAADEGAEGVKAGVA